MRGALFVLGLALVACDRSPADDVKPAPEQACAKAFAQCKLAGGALGVCNEIECGAGQQAPCFKCVSQH